MEPPAAQKGRCEALGAAAPDSGKLQFLLFLPPFTMHLVDLGVLCDPQVVCDPQVAPFFQFRRAGPTCTAPRLHRHRRRQVCMSQPA